MTSLRGLQYTHQQPRAQELQKRQAGQTPGSFSVCINSLELHVPTVFIRLT